MLRTILAFVHARLMAAHFRGSLQDLKDLLLPFDLDHHREDLGAAFAGQLVHSTKYKLI
jgi:hypothetical protein